MKIWGKIVGGTAGFAIGGPIGALLGVIAGHAVDHYVLERSSPTRSDDGRPADIRACARSPSPSA